ncbi:MAG TPA: hypothetical protein VIL04_03250 [Solirubrobacterales bacterium]
MRRMKEVAVLLAVALLCIPAAAEAQTTFKAGPVHYVFRNANVAPSSSDGITVYCNPKTRVAAGGYGANGPLLDASLAGSHPVDGGDPDLVRDDGWRLGVYNSGSQSLKVKFAEVCLRPGLAANALAYASTDHNVAMGTFTTIYGSTCPQGRVVGGGVQFGGGAINAVRIDSTSPYSTLGWEQPPDDGWTSRVTVQGPATNTSHVICMTGDDVALRYRKREAIVRGGQTKRIVARCPKGKGWRVIGGGVAGFFLRIKQSLPWDSKDKRKVPEDGCLVRAGLPFPNSKPVVATATAICAKKT